MVYKMLESPHQLAAIMFSDIVGYTAIMGADVESGLELLRKNRHIHQTFIDKYHGKLLKEMGDGTLAQFNSAIDAIRCALEIQKRSGAEFEAKIRIGIHLGDVTIENEDVFGEGVNIASRLQSIADPGGIYFSESIYEAIRARKDVRCEVLGDVHLKNVDHPVRTYYLQDKELPIPPARKRRELTEQYRKPLLKQARFYVFALIILSGIILTGIWLSNMKANGIHSLAVLPVENLSGNEDEKWLMAGIHNGLIDELTKIKEIRVVPRRSTMKYEFTDKSIPEIARELDVEGVLEPTLIKTSNNVNIQVRLIQAFPEEKQLWAQSYNRNMAEILTVYSEATRAIVEKIDIPISPEEDILLSRSKIVNPIAYEAYLKGTEYLEKLDDASLNKAMQYFELARETDPNFAPAYFGTAICWGGKMQGGFLPYRIAGVNLKTAMNQALSLDSTIIEAHYFNAISNTWYFWNWENAEKEFQITLNLNPNHALGLAYYAHYLAIIGQPEQGLPYIERAIKLEKSNGLIAGLYGMHLRYVHRYDQAITYLEEAREKFPDEMILFSTLRSAYHDKQMYDEAIQAGIKYYEIRGDSSCIRALKEGYRDAGYQLALQRNAEALIDQKKSRYITPWQITTLYVRAGMYEETINWLEQGYEEHDANMPYISIDPIFDDLKEDPRFKEILKKMELPE